MQISGLVITMNPGTNPGSVQDALSARPEFVVGEAHDRWVSVAMEAPDEAGSWALHDWLRALPGVAHVDVVHVHLGTEDGVEGAADADCQVRPGGPGRRNEKTPRD